jgi:CRISPR type IV-associated protein Csf3
MEAMVVIARLAQGYSAADPWSPSLDGILAYWRLREELGEEELTLGMTGHRPLVVADLPLQRESWGDMWWWQCSSPMPAGGDEERFERHYHRRFDEGQAYRYAPKGTRAVLTSAGPYKAYRHRRQIVVCEELRWHAIGDAAEVRRLLRRCDFIGHGIGRGWGEVIEWTIEPGGDEWLARYHRPLPYEFAEAHGLRGAPLEWGLVPPGRDPRNRALCVMPV